MCLLWLVAIRLCDYASLGLTGTHFTTWFPVVPPTEANPLPSNVPFTRADPSRTVFVETLAELAPLCAHKCYGDSPRQLRVKLAVRDEKGVGVRYHRFGCDSSHDLGAFCQQVGLMLAKSDLSAVSALEYATTDRADHWLSLTTEHDWRVCVSSTPHEGLLRVRCTVENV